MIVSGKEAQETKEDSADSSDRGTARLFAVQALYQIALSGQSVDLTIEDFLLNRLDSDSEAFKKPEREHFSRILKGVPKCQEDLDSMIKANLSADWTLERLPLILLLLLRAGVFELLSCRDVPARVVISEYIDLTHAFFEGKEPSFVNAILDSLAHRLRQDEMVKTDDQKPPQ